MSFFESMLPFGLSWPDVVLLMTAMASLISVFAVWNVLVVRDPLAPRIKAMKERREALRAGMLRPETHRRERRIKSVNLMREIVRRLKLLKWQRSTAITQRLATAGWRSRDAVIIYLFFKVATPLLFGAVTAFFLFGTGAYDLPAAARILVAAVAAGVGFTLPDVMVKNQATRRQKDIRKAMPDALDLMVICAEAGLSIDATFARVSREMAQASPVMADELGLTAIELSFLPDRSKALHNLIHRTDMAEVRGMVNTLLQTEKYGTPLSQALRVLSAEFREQRLLRAEEKAARLPAILTVPMIIFILPCLFIVLLGPAALRTIDALGGLN